MGKKLTLFLIDGNDKGPRTIEIGNWSGKAIHSPRSTLSKMLKRVEYDNPGVYILKSDPNEDLYQERIYIGEAENIRKRLKQHLADEKKDFNECIVFISKDELLTKSHVKYIESRLLTIAMEARNSEIENGTQPNLNMLSEADISDMEYYIEQIKIILPTAGYLFLTSNRVEENYNQKQAEEIEEVVFYLRGNKVKASLIQVQDSFKVLKNSEATISTSNSISPGRIKQRERFIKDGIWIKDENNKKYIFQEDVLFNSLSAAASVILGRQAAGPICWVDQNKRTFKAYEAEQLENINDEI